MGQNFVIDDDRVQRVSAELRASSAATAATGWPSYCTSSPPTLHHGKDALDLLAGGGVDRLDAGVGVRGDEEAADDHAGQPHVVGVDGGAGASAGPSARGIGVLRTRCLSLGPHAGPPVSSTSISTSVATPLTTFGTLIFFFFVGCVSAMTPTLMCPYSLSRVATRVRNSVSATPCPSVRPRLLRSAGLGGGHGGFKNVRVGAAAAEVALAASLDLLGRGDGFFSRRR